MTDVHLKADLEGPTKRKTQVTLSWRVTILRMNSIASLSQPKHPYQITSMPIELPCWAPSHLFPFKAF